MAAFGTKKKGGDVAVQLTFPQVFQSVYDHPMMYYPQGHGGALDVMVGNDFQANYHEQKRQDANRSVMDGLQARRTQQRLLLTGHQNYHLPKPVLGERRFANPSMGAVGFSSARQDGCVDAPFRLMEASLTGGVLRTAEGQGYIQRKRMERIEQLDRIDALASGQQVTAAAPMEGATETVPEKLKIEFNLLRQALLDDLVVGVVNRFTYDNMKRMLDILFRLGPLADRTTLEDLLSGFDLMVTQIRALLGGTALDEDAVDRVTQLSLSMLIERARDYVEEMIRGMNRSPKERQALSRAVVKNLKFSDLFKKTPQEAVAVARRRGVMNPRERQDDMDDDGDDDDGDLGRPARGREDGEQRGAERAPLAGVGFDENRLAFGERAGRYLPGGGGEVRQQPAYIDALAPAEDEETPFQEEVATQRALEQIVEELGGREGMDEDALLRQAYGEPNEEGRISALDEELQRRVEQMRAEAAGQRRRGRPGAAAASAALAQGDVRRRLFGAEEELAEEEGEAAPRGVAEGELPQTREQFEEIVATEQGRAELARLLGYTPRAGSAVKTVRSTLLLKLRERGVDLLRAYSRR